MHIDWTDIHPDGTESLRSGEILAPEPPLAGMRAVRVQPDDTASTVTVVISSRRHRTGRELVAGVHGLNRTPQTKVIYSPDGGRYVDKGEAYRETDPRSKFGS